MLKKLILCGASTLLWAQPALAATLVDNPASTGIQPSPGVLSYVFNAGAGAGQIGFNLEGYLSLDGLGCCTDIFNVDLNGSTLLNGSYDLGGGGSNVTNFLIAGGSFSSMSNGFFNGGSGTGSLPVTFLNGLNTITFSYSGDPQTLGDEGWGLNSLLVTGNAFTSAVPEPATWAMLLMGFAAIGGAMRSRRRESLAVTYG